MASVGIAYRILLSERKTVHIDSAKLGVGVIYAGDSSVFAHLKHRLRVIGLASPACHRGNLVLLGISPSGYANYKRVRVSLLHLCNAGVYRALEGGRIGAFLIAQLNASRPVVRTALKQYDIHVVSVLGGKIVLPARYHRNLFGGISVVNAYRASADAVVDIGHSVLFTDKVDVGFCLTHSVAREKTVADSVHSESVKLGIMNVGIRNFRRCG